MYAEKYLRQLNYKSGQRSKGTPKEVRFLYFVKTGKCPTNMFADLRERGREGEGGRERERERGTTM